MTAVYRVWSATDELLYIGVSTNPLARTMQHAAEKSWWDDVARITLEHFESAEDAATAEGVAIQQESPLHNVSRSPRRPRLAEWKREREEMAQTHYEPPLGFECAHCGERPRWVPKGTRLADMECPVCECAMTDAKPNLKVVS